MLLLTATTDKVQVVTASAVTVDVHASYMDMTQADPPVVKGTTSGRTNTTIATATTTDVVAAPAASTTRNIKELHVQNNHASSSNLVTVQFNQNGTLFLLESVTLLAGERLTYVDGKGFELVDAAGITKSNATTIAGQIAVARLGTDLANATTTAAKVTGMDTACGIGTWLFEYFLLYTSTVVTTGIKFGVNHTGTVTSFVYDMYGTTADITTNTSLMDQDVLLTTGATMSSWAARAKSTTAPMITSGVDTINVDTFMMVSGMLVCTVTGNLELYHASETANSTTVKAGSALRLTKVG